MNRARRLRLSLDLLRGFRAAATRAAVGPLVSWLQGEARGDGPLAPASKRKPKDR
jgi:hypothetical protein